MSAKPLSSTRETDEAPDELFVDHSARIVFRAAFAETRRDRHSVRNATRDEVANDYHHGTNDTITFELRKDRSVLRVRRLQPPARAIDDESLERLLAVDHRDHDGAVSNLLLGIDDDEVTVQDVAPSMESPRAYTANAVGPSRHGT